MHVAMKMVRNIIDHLPRFSTVLVACNGGTDPRYLIETLEERGLSILGPAYTKDHALTLAAHSRADLALVQVQPGEDDNGQALAGQLQQTWGIPALLIPATA